MTTKKKAATRRLVSLGQFIPMLSRQWENPVHLAPMLSRLERALVEPMRCAFSVCPRVGKTEALLHAIPWWLLQRPDLRIAFAGYSQRFAERRTRRARALAEAAGVRLDPTASSKSDWRTTSGDGGVWATSIDGSVTGEGFDIVILDDPHKDRAAAESSAERDRLDEWFRDVLFTRLEPNGSIFVNHARWHVDDQIGRLERDGWDCISLPAIDDEGRSIWPSRWPVERLREIEETLGPYGWSSLYQQQPQPRGGRPFDGVEFFDELPSVLRVTTTGVDLAYTASKTADRSVAVTIASDGERFYVLDVRVQQVAATVFRETLKSVTTDHPTTSLHAYIGGTERAVIDFLAEDGVSITATPAVADKFVRAQPAAAAWSAKKILVPRSMAALRRPGDAEQPDDRERRPPWLDAFVSEVVAFTGVRDRRDDQVDALVAAYDAAKVRAYSNADGRPSCTTVYGSGSRYADMGDGGRGFG